MAVSLAGCGRIDADQARICRATLPALEPSGTQIIVERAAPGAAPRSLRVDYTATRPGRAPQGRFAICRFADEGLGAGKADLAGITTPGGDVPGASLYLLKRYYLDTQDAVTAAPAPEDARADLPLLPAPLAYGLQQLLVGLPGMALYSLLAAAYALLFGLVGRINLAFGEIAAVGAAAAGLGVALFVAGGLTATIPGLAFGIALAIFAGGLHGAATGTIAFGWISPRNAQASLIATIGLSLALMEYLRLAGGTVPLWIPPLGGGPVALARAGSFIVTLTPVAAFTALVGFAGAAALVALMRYSGFGRAWRALADDALAAALFGIDGGRLRTLTLLLAGGLAGLAGALVAIQFGALGFAGGFQFGLKALAAAILGGVASVGGALVGGLAIGAFETLWSAYLPIEGRDLALYLVLIAAIVLRPNGFAGCQPPRDRV